MWEGGEYQDFFDVPYDKPIILTNFFDPTHVYELKLGAIAQSGRDRTAAFIEADISVLQIPEPTTFVLMSIVLSGIFFRASKFSKNRKITA